MTLKNNTDLPYSFAVFDIHGHLIVENPLVLDPTHRLDFYYPAGMYLLKVESVVGTEIHRVIKE
jgi:hypothetical protein